MSCTSTVVFSFSSSEKGHEQGASENQENQSGLRSGNVLPLTRKGWIASDFFELINLCLWGACEEIGEDIGSTNSGLL